MLEDNYLRSDGPDLSDSPQQVLPLIGTLYWQIATRTRAFSDLLNETGADPAPRTSRFGESRATDSAFVVAREGGRLDLVYFTDEGAAPTGSTSYFEPSATDLEQAWFAWRESVLGFTSSLQASPLRGLGPEWAHEVTRRWPFEVAFAPVPSVERTSALDASTTRDGDADSTVGTPARTEDGVEGVTVSLHALRDRGWSPGAPIYLDEGRVVGEMVSTDDTSDSGFVRCDVGALSLATRPILSRQTPRQYGAATFERLEAPEPVTTFITAWCPDIPWVQPYVQMRVLTHACTKRGDSGAALVDEDGRVVGFSMYRTGLGSPIEFSAWIWADSVFQAHELQ